MIRGNWFGVPTTYADVWNTGYSKAWGKNVGDMPSVTCISTALYVTNGALPSDSCVTSEVVKGTPPLSGTFKLTLNTTDHLVINVQDSLTTTAIAHNAFGNSVESGGDGSSVQEKLSALLNVGDISVSRSDVSRFE
jgi:hypothetical protein